MDDGSEICLKIFEKCFNEIMETEKPPESWKRSKTVMIPKKKKPKVKDFRPIALTNVECKIFMSVIKEKIVTHLIANDEVHFSQMGFTRGRRLEDNLFMLVYCLRSAERMKKNLIIIAVDFAKPFDSVSRVNLIRTLVYLWQAGGAATK